MIHWLKIIRPINLIVIAITMYSVRFFFHEHPHTPFSLSFQIDFFLLVLSTILIASGGNIINDYFDIKADRVNKPHKMIIEKHIKPRLAIVAHWILNLVSMAIGVYLSIKYQTWFYVFLHLISINILWLYSLVLKRKFLLGNLLIAFLTALVPVIAWYFSSQEKALGIVEIESMNSNGFKGKNLLILAFVSFAFILNFIREIIKDIEDLEGDKLLSSNSFPILYGEKKARRFSQLFLTLSLILPAGMLLILKPYFEKLAFPFNFFNLLPMFIIGACLVFSFLLLNKTERKTLKNADRLLKLSMILGVLLPFYWYFL